MQARSAFDTDVPAITDLRRRWDTAWFGAPEHDENEVRQDLERVRPLAERSRLLTDAGGRVVAAAWWWAPDATTLVVDPRLPEADLVSGYDDLLAWFAQGGATEVEALGRDVLLQRALERHGWEHWLSSFELIRAVDGDWRLAGPSWPDGVRIADLRPQDAAAVHRLVYDEAGWADVPGHGARDLEEWRSLFLTDDVPAEQHVVAWRGERVVGVALGKIFSDGTGWVPQLAVAREERGRGLGRALLLEALRRKVAAGAQQLGLAVSAENAGALRLYLDVGLTVDREWMRYRPSPR